MERACRRSWRNHLAKTLMTVLRPSRLLRGVVMDGWQVWDRRYDGHTARTLCASGPFKTRWLECSRWHPENRYGVRLASGEQIRYGRPGAIHGHRRLQAEALDVALVWPSCGSPAELRWMRSRHTDSSEEGLRLLSIGVRTTGASSPDARRDPRAWRRRASGSCPSRRSARTVRPRTCSSARQVRRPGPSGTRYRCGEPGRSSPG